MPRWMVGLLAAVGAAMATLVPFEHGALVGVTIADAALAMGLAAYGALPQEKNLLAFSSRLIFDGAHRSSYP